MAGEAADADGGLLFGLSSEDFDLDSIERDLRRFQEDEVVRDALGQGVDLRQYARQIDADLRALQSGSVPAFIEEAPTSAALFEQLSECDGILASMESILQGFQADLGGISDEIKHLQDESLSMNVKLKNRKEVEAQLCAILGNLVVSDALISGICQSEVNEDYLLYVQDLDEKMRFARSKEPVGAAGVAPSEMLAVQEVEPQLERLRLKAVAKVRVFLLDQIAALKRPKTNVQIMQQNVMIKFRYFVQFLAANAPAVAEEIKGTYVDTMSRILHQLFKSYYTSLTKLQLPGPAKDDVVAGEDAAIEAAAKSPASLFSSPGQSASTKLARREAELGEPDAAPIIVHVARSGGQKLFFEAIFRSVQKHLMDSATSEFLFILDFFDAKSNELFNQIFARTLSLCLESVENFLYNCNDVVALLLMIRTSQAHRLIMERRRVPCLDGYFDHVNMLLWPTFKKAFDANLKSLQQASLARLGLQRLDLGACSVSRRYAEFASSIHALSTSLSASDEMLPLNLAKMRGAYVELVDKLVDGACQMRQHHRALDTAKGRHIFRINNLDAVLANMSDAALGEDITFFEDLLAQETSLYIEEELAQSFKSMISYIRETEGSSSEGSSASAEAAGAARTSAAQLSAIIQEFAGGWKSGLELLDSAVTNYFSSPENAREILKQMLTQFLLYYTRFQDLVRAHQDQKLQARLVSIQEIMAEMKRYSKGG